MIKLNKLSEPQLLKDDGQSWTTEYLKYKHKGWDIPTTLKRKYRSPEIKEQLFKETFEKCAYCESKMKHIDYGNIEHILPKEKHPELIFDWDNLTLSCRVCNTNKGEFEDATYPLLNPYVDNPEDYLFAAGPCIFHKIGKGRGEITVKKIDLDRTDLVERRKERIESINNLVERCNSETNPVIKQTLRDEIIKETEEEKEFSFVIKQYLINIGLV